MEHLTFQLIADSYNGFAEIQSNQIENVIKWEHYVNDSDIHFRLCDIYFDTSWHIGLF